MPLIIKVNTQKRHAQVK